MGMIKVDECTLKFVFDNMLSVITDMEENCVSESTFRKTEQIKQLVEFMQQEREKMDIRDILYQIRKNSTVKMKEAELTGDEKTVKECRKNLAITEKQISETKAQLFKIRDKLEKFMTKAITEKNQEEEG